MAQPRPEMNFGGGSGARPRAMSSSSSGGARHHLRRAMTADRLVRPRRSRLPRRALRPTGGTDAGALNSARPVARPRPRPPRKKALPDWTRQASFTPSPSFLAKLEGAIKAKPLDLSLRNKLAWALRKAWKMKDLLAMALDWQIYNPDNPMVYEYLGEAYDAADDTDRALRAFSSIAEVSPGDSGLLNRAGYVCLRAKKAKMAETLFRFAIERRPGHANNYRGLALALWFQGRHEAAVEALGEGLKRNYNARYKNVKRILREEASLVFAAWLAVDPARADAIRAKAKDMGCDPAYGVDLRITLHWETDANDVDLHVVDPNGEECYYSHKRNRSGLELYEDLTQGLGPECAVVPRGKALPGPYHVGVKYFRAGPMGVSRGVVVIQRPSGADGLPRVRIEPFILLPDLEGIKQDMRHVSVEEMGD